MVLVPWRTGASSDEKKTRSRETTHFLFRELPHTALGLPLRRTLRIPIRPLVLRQNLLPQT